ncbi:unnamed protein product, partial [Phytomonas sp. EM1]
MPPATTSFQRQKQLYTDEEEKLAEIVSDDSFTRVFQSWLDTMISQLDYQYENCERQLSELQQSTSVPAGSFWCSKTIMQHCNLLLSEKRLVKKKLGDLPDNTVKGIGKDEKDHGEVEGEQAKLPDLVRLASCLQQIKSSHFVTQKQKLFLEQFEERLKTVQFEPLDLIFILNALETKLKTEDTTRAVFEDLTALQNSIEDLLPSAERCEQLLEASIVNGEMALAEDISKRQLDTYEHILHLTTDQYPIISKHHLDSCEGNRKRRWAIFRMADRDITTVIENKERAIETCQEDFAKIKEQLGNYSNDDVQQRKRYELDRAESDAFLQQNKEKQQGVWNRIFGLFEELKTCQGELVTLAQQRKKEVQRRLEAEEREAGRRSGHESFLHAAEVHSKLLQDTIDNASAARDLVEALNNFVLDGCDSITARYDQQQQVLHELLHDVHHHHFERFTAYYIAANRYLYRKERSLAKLKDEITRNEQQRELKCEVLDPAAKLFAEANVQLTRTYHDVAQEVLQLRDRIDRAERALAPTLKAFELAGVVYTHPSVLVEEMNLSRWSKITDYRAILRVSRSPRERRVEEFRQECRSLRGLIGAMEGAGALTRDADGTWRSRTRRGPFQLPPAAEAAAAAREGPSKREEEGEREKTLPALVAARPPVFSALTNTTPAVGSSPKERVFLPRMPHASSVGCSVNSTTSDSSSSKGTSHNPKAEFHRRVEGGVFRALHTYRSRAPDELNFEKGDSIICIGQTPEEGWFKGICNQRTGIFPINYVELEVPH